MTIELWWQTTLFKGNHISVVSQDFTNNDTAWKYEVVIRNKISWIVSVLPITENNEVVLIRQFRIPLWREVIEQPAGLNDRPGATDLDAAKWELLEETWYASDDIEYIHTVPTSSGLTNELVSCFIARNCRKVSDRLSLDSSESISLLVLPIEKTLRYLYEEARKWRLVDSKVFMMLQYYLSPSGTIR